MMARAGQWCVLFLALAGCADQPTKVEKKAGKPKARFSLTAEPQALEVLNGQQVEATVTVRRQSGGAEEVELSAEVQPAAGVTAKLQQEKVQPADAKEKAVRLSVSASETARAGEYTVVVTGRAEASADVKTRVSVKVPPRD